MAKQPQFVPVEERALFQRINRKLQQQENPEKLVATRGEKARETLGDYYTVEADTFGQQQSAVSRGVCLVDVDLEKLGRKLGVLKSYEALVK